MKKLSRKVICYLLASVCFFSLILTNPTVVTAHNSTQNSQENIVIIDSEEALEYYNTTNFWDNNFQVKISLDQSSDWTVEFDSPNTLSHAWNCTFTKTSNNDSTYHYVFTPPSFNSSVFEFIAQGNKDILPSNMKITYITGPIVPPFQETPIYGFLHVEGNQLYDNANKPVRITGVNWFGFETTACVVHGRWKRDYKIMLNQIKDVGFNTIRLPWANHIMDPNRNPMTIGFGNTDPVDQTPNTNSDLKDMNCLETLDAIIDYAGKIGLRIILDNHSREPDAYMQETLWYTDKFTEEQWIADWVTLAERYKDNPTVIGFDLNNEPHVNATWGNSNPSTDWNKACERCGNAILEANPNVLIIVEGVEKYNGDGYWWGGNLSGVRDYPINISNPSKLVYSMHEYGPNVHNQEWFSAPDFPNNMPKVWYDHFGFIRDENIGHLLCGEFGIQANSGVQKTWFIEFMKAYGADTSWTFWCWNPNSGDTGGILDTNWETIVDWKVDYIKPYFDELILGEDLGK